MNRPSGPDRQALAERAARRQGVFTLSDALSCGYSEPLVYHFVRTGLFEQFGRTFYRLTNYRERKPAGFDTFPRNSA